MKRIKALFIPVCAIALLASTTTLTVQAQTLSETPDTEQKQEQEQEHIHNVTYVTEIPATCTESGTKAYWHCEGCQKKYADETALTEMTETDMSIPAKDHLHTETRNTKTATCTKTGYTGDVYCINCNVVLQKGIKISATGHTWNNGVISKKPTAVSKGQKTYTCKTCKEKKKEHIPALGIPEKGSVLKSGKYSYVVTKKGAKNGAVAFKEVTSAIANVTVPKTITVDGITYRVTSIADKALFKNKHIQKITLNENIKTVGADAFTGCSKLKKVDVKKGTLFIVGNYKYTITGRTTVSFAGLKKNTMQKVTIPKTVKIGKKVYTITTIGENAFKNNKNVTNITILSNIKKICKSAFKGCSKLSNVTFGSKLEIIDEQAFMNCKKLSNVVFGSSLQEIGKEAFMGCDSITRIVVPKNVKTVGVSAFKDCKNLKEYIKEHAEVEQVQEQPQQEPAPEPEPESKPESSVSGLNSVQQAAVNAGYYNVVPAPSGGYCVLVRVDEYTKGLEIISGYLRNIGLQPCGCVGGTISYENDWELVHVTEVTEYQVKFDPNDTEAIFGN